jgi:hypothetical protein
MQQGTAILLKIAWGQPSRIVLLMTMCTAYSYSHTSVVGAFQQKLLDHPPYNPALALSDYDLFT